MKSRDRAACTRRGFLLFLPAAASFAAEVNGKGRIFPSAITRYPDPATEFVISRLTDPTHTSILPAYYNRAISKRSNFLLYSSDMTGNFEAFRMDLKTGQSRQLTEAAKLDPASLVLSPDERSFYYFDGDRLIDASLSTLRTREVYRVPENFERGAGWSIAEDGQYAAVVEKNGATHRLQLVQIATGTATKLVECEEQISAPMPRPRRASILYSRAGGVWLANYDGKLNYRLRLAEGETGPALWSPDGREVLYLNYPEDKHRLHNLRTFTPDSNGEKAIADTTQFVHFGCNADASVFVGASGSKASPYVLLLVRSVKREMTLAEHRASDPAMVAPIFAPNSQRVFFASDRHGKPAIYTIAVDRFVEETER